MENSTIQMIFFFLVGLLIFFIKTLIGIIKKRRQKNEETETGTISEE